MNQSYPFYEWAKFCFSEGYALKILYGITAHPQESPTEAELCAYLSGTQSEIQTTINALIEHGILQTIQLKQNQFIGFTTQGKQFVIDSNIYTSNSILKATVDTATDETIVRGKQQNRPQKYLTEITLSQPEKQYQRAFTKTQWNRAKEQSTVPIQIDIMTEKHTVYILIFEYESTTPLYIQQHTIDKKLPEMTHTVTKEIYRYQIDEANFSTTVYQPSTSTFQNSISVSIVSGETNIYSDFIQL